MDYLYNYNMWGFAALHPQLPITLTVMTFNLTCEAIYVREGGGIFELVHPVNFAPPQFKQIQYSIRDTSANISS